MNELNETTSLVPTGCGKPEPGPGEGPRCNLTPGYDLTPVQREAVQLSVIGGLTNEQVAEAVRMSGRSIRRWRACQWWREYASHLVEVVTAEATLQARARMARWLPQAGDQLGSIAAGVSKHSSPYQVDAQRALFDRAVGKPPSADVAVKVEGKTGDVYIVTRRVD